MKKRNLSATKQIHNFYLKKLNNPRIKKVYSEFEKNLGKYNSSKFSIAVSGGADSMALAFLAKCHSIKKKLNHLYFTVDHKLRNDSTKEAILTKKQLKKFGIICDILTWRNNNTSSNFQAKAREKRYELIFKKSLNNKVNLVLTAHQKNDLYENFFIRLLRGSGLKGLSSFQSKKTKINKNSNVFVLRPLLSISKKELYYITKNTFNFYIDDPSNKDSEYLRSRVRFMINNLKKDGLDEKKFKMTFNNLVSSNNSIEFFVQKNISENSSISHTKNNKRRAFLSSSFFKNTDEIILRSFTKILQNISGRYFPARGNSVSNIIDQIRQNSTTKTTVGGCVIEKIENSFVIYKEITK